ncbi:alanine--tRNA ligase, mitochondrial isoform X3 [Oryzias latipes]|uniref:alanine--tRNA ligase, mitochondrial isoform X3 n=1 Tax=Oryzias latipes TaxID=8090 RepID=UPI000CE20B4A|nr:alanine--tRNA ligase, mitochondrial isoform X3 [Oryzias latipes]
MTWRTWAETSTTTPSLRCWGTGPLETTLRWRLVKWRGAFSLSTMGFLLTDYMCRTSGETLHLGYHRMRRRETSGWTWGFLLVAFCPLAWRTISGRWGILGLVGPAQRFTLTTWGSVMLLSLLTQAVQMWWRSGTWSLFSTTGNRTAVSGCCRASAWIPGWDWRDWCSPSLSPPHQRLYRHAETVRSLQRSGVGPYTGRTGTEEGSQVDLAYRVVADHIRTLSICIADGIHPGMSGAELVLRRILRRAVRFCIQVLQAPQGALASLVPTITQLLGDAYPELKQEEDRIVDIINENEAQFLASLQQGSRIIQRTLSKKDCKHSGFPASLAWTLHRDLGFPLDLVDMMLEERGVQVNRQDLDRLLLENQKVASEKRAGLWSHVMLDLHILAELQRLKVPHTDDSLKYQYGLEKDRYVFPACSATVLALCNGQTLVQEVSEGQRCAVILDRTCFYSEQGGQSHDRGYLTCSRLQDVVFPVDGLLQVGGYVVHQVTATDRLKTGDQVQLHLDQAHRLSCMVKHTATHILNFALRKVLGPSVHQRGSHVSADRLRFDFSVKGSLSIPQLQQVERCVHDIVTANQMVHTMELPMQRAKSIRGLRTVDEVYPDPVRVVSLHVPVSELLDSPPDKDTSVELCCGTHLLRTGAIEDLVIVSEKQMVKGISRVVAVTGRDAAQAREAGQALSQEVDSLSARLSGSSPSSIDSAQRLSKEASILSDAVDNTPIPQWQRRELQDRLKTLLRTSNSAIRKMELREAAQKAQAILEKNGRKTLLVDFVEAESLSVLVKTVNQLSSAAPFSHVMLLTRHAHSGKVLCACQVPKDSPTLAASDWAVAVCGYLGGSAGGSTLVAKGTGTSDDITEALRWAEDFVAQKRRR